MGFDWEAARRKKVDRMAPQYAETLAEVRERAVKGDLLCSGHDILFLLSLVDYLGEKADAYEAASWYDSGAY